ncbi:hypothetical protein JXR93_02000 [bacterium]|nr:hypothetical protein [bacterium]
MKITTLLFLVSLLMLSCGDDSSGNMSYTLTNNTSKVIQSIYVTDGGDDVVFTGNEKLLLNEPLNIGAKKNFKFSCKESTGYKMFFVFEGDEKPKMSDGGDCCDKVTNEIRDFGGSYSCEDSI